MAEKKTTLANYWHPIAPAAEIADEPRAYTLLGEDLVAYRAPVGVVVSQDLCVHRGTALSLGRVETATSFAPAKAGTTTARASAYSSRRCRTARRSRRRPASPHIRRSSKQIWCGLRSTSRRNRFPGRPTMPGTIRISRLSRRRLSLEVVDRARESIGTKITTRPFNGGRPGDRNLDADPLDRQPTQLRQIEPHCCVPYPRK